MTYPRVPTDDRTPGWGRSVAGAINWLLNRRTSSRAVTGSGSIAPDDYMLLVNASGGAVTLTLPPVGNSPDASFLIKKTDATANTVTVDGSGAETIDGAATKVISSQWEAYQFYSNGTAWYVF